MRRLATGLLLALGLLPGLLAAQQTDLRKQILDSQRRLEQIKAERQRLEEEMRGVQAHVRDASQELANVEQRLSQSRSIMAEIQLQTTATSKEVQATTKDLLETREHLAMSKAVLYRRMRDIYEMGPLHTMRVLLGATSFTDLLNRYRYLKRIATFDKALVGRVTELQDSLVAETNDLHKRMSALGSLRQTRQAEVARLRSIESERKSALADYRSRATKTKNRIQELQDDQRRMGTLIADLERRREEAANAGPTANATLSKSDEGRLPWPLDGKIIYRFGRDRRPNGTVLRWNGIGIAAPVGTPVRAVRAGRVVLAGPFEGYGPTVVVSNGGGFYTLYLYLKEIGVVEGREVKAGQVIGTVGGSATPEGPHIEFQIRAPQRGGSPVAQNPLQWLRSRNGG